MKKSRMLSAAVLALAGCLVVGCGGDGSSPPSTGSGGGSPTPSPTPSATYSIAVTGPLIARVVFDSDQNGAFATSGDAVSGTDLDGRLGGGIATLEPQINSGKIPASAGVRIEASGVDTLTGLVFTQMRAPAGATVVSPLTALIDAAGSETAVRTALGLQDGSGTLRGNVNLATFNPASNLNSSDADVRYNAGRLMALNLQLAALARILQNTNGDPVDYPVTFIDGSEIMAQQIAETGQLDFTDPATIKALLKRSRYQYGTPDAQLDAMAALAATYNAAVPTDLVSDENVRGWAWAFRFSVMPDFKILSQSWPSAAAGRIAAIDATQLGQDAAYFASVPGPTPGAYMAVTDYHEYPSPPVLRETIDGCAGRAVLPSCNDLSFLVPSYGDDRLISVESLRPGAIAPSMESNLLRYRRPGPYYGIVAIKYTSQSDRGELADGIAFVRVRRPD